MRKSIGNPRNLQQVALYLLAAGSLGFALYAELFLFYVPTVSPDSPATRISATWQIWLIIPALLLLVFSMGLALIRPRAGARLALLAVTFGLAYSATRFCPAAVYLAGLVFFPMMFMAVVLPPLALGLTLAYSVHVVRSGPDAKPLVQWLSERPLLGCFLAGPVLAGLALAVGYIGLQAAVGHPMPEEHPMTWQDTSNSRCPHEVTLEFDETPGYRIWTCSADLLGYLQPTAGTQVVVTFERTFSWGRWDYRVLQVGAWPSTARFEGVQLVQSCSASICSQVADHSPLRDPYTLR